MANRKRGSDSIIPPELQTTEKILTKQQSALLAARTNPGCPPVPYKLRKTVLTTANTDSMYRARPVSFKGNVSLSPDYDPKNGFSYLDQIFPVKSLVGEGSFGRVYHAKTANGQVYAIKKLKPVRLEKYRYTEVKNNECIGYHPNIVHYYLAWEEAFEIYIQLEYCTLSLADYVKLDGEVNNIFLWQLLNDMALALQYLHQKQLIHLDVKPANIMMKHGTFKLCDFGTLIDISLEPEFEKTLSDGDSKYLAKEVLSGIYTTSIDIYGLGITLLELAGNFDLPGAGPIWAQLRNDILPKEFYDDVNYSYPFKILIESLMKADYKLRPTAECILRIPNVREIRRHGAKQARPDYDGELLLRKGFREVPFVPLNHNNNNDATPPSTFTAHHSRLDNPVCDIRRVDVQNQSNGMFRRDLFSSTSTLRSKPNVDDKEDDDEYGQLVDNTTNLRLTGLEEIQGGIINSNTCTTFSSTSAEKREGIPLSDNNESPRRPSTVVKASAHGIKAAKTWSNSPVLERDLPAEALEYRPSINAWNYRAEEEAPNDVVELEMNPAKEEAPNDVLSQLHAGFSAYKRIKHISFDKTEAELPQEVEVKPAKEMAPNHAMTAKIPAIKGWPRRLPSRHKMHLEKADSPPKNMELNPAKEVALNDVRPAMREQNLNNIKWPSRFPKTRLSYHEKTDSKLSDRLGRDPKRQSISPDPVLENFGPTLRISRVRGRGRF